MPVLILKGSKDVATSIVNYVPRSPFERQVAQTSA